MVRVLIETFVNTISNVTFKKLKSGPGQTVDILTRRTMRSLVIEF